MTAVTVPKAAFVRAGSVCIWIAERRRGNARFSTLLNTEIALNLLLHQVNHVNQDSRHAILTCSVFLQDCGAFTIVPLASQRFLVKLFVFFDVHPFLPRIDVDFFLVAFEGGEALNFLLLPVRRIVSKSSQAAEYLRWETDGPLVPARMFAGRLFIGPYFAINTCQEIDPLINVQLLGLLALHCDGSHEASRKKGIVGFSRYIETPT